MRVGTLHKLNAKGIRSAGDGMHSDGGGLFLRVKGSGRAWVFRYTIDGKKREMGLGSLSSVSLASARERAAAAREIVTAGGDPLEQRTAPRAAPVVRKSPTFEKAMEQYIQTHAPTWSNAKHGKQWDASLRLHAAPLLGMKVGDITPADVEAVLLPIWLSKMETASRVRQRIERILSASIARGDRPAPNPAALRDNLEHMLPSQAKLRAVKHHAAIPFLDAPAAFQAIWAKKHKGIGYSALITLILTALRSGEVRHLEWADIDGDTITIDSSRMKARKSHRAPVSGPLADHLASTHRIAGTALVHGGNGGRPMSDMTIAKAMKGAGYGGFTPHGWRSTFSDWANAEGWSRDLIEDQLAHTVGNAVERAYRRSDFLERRRPMMEAWASYLLNKG